MSVAVEPSITCHVHVVEDHNEALPHIYRAIASKRLPFSGNILLHFDAHPDLLSPDIKADDVSKKELLFSKTSIAEWILPAIYMGHFGRVMWVRPVWAKQIKEGIHQLTVGRDKSSGKIRVSSALPYFISELLYVAEEDLENTVTIPLNVLTLYPLHTSSTDDEHVMEMLEGEDLRINAETENFLPPCKKMKQVLSEVINSISTDRTSFCDDEKILNSSKAWVLDIDLDFFSTGNPFRPIYSEEQYQLLERLYQLKEPENDEPAVVSECVQRREKQLSRLEQLWLTNLTERDKLELNLCPKDLALIKEMKEMIGSIRNDSFIDAEYLHWSGMMTDLPVHTSSEEEISGLVSSISTFLQKVDKRPSLITISRSAEDDYTPLTQVETIQEKVISALELIYRNKDSKREPLHHLEIHHHYTPTPSPVFTNEITMSYSFYEPSKICDCSYL